MARASDRLDPAKPQIRVLHIQKTTGHRAVDGPGRVIRCKVETVSLDTQPAPEFVALSYVWGDPTNTRRILIDGRSVYITENLYKALSWHRDNKTWRPKNQLAIWADAICINQDNADEKIHQIKLMKRIYQQATCVLCWLHSDSSPRMDFYLRHQTLRSGDLQELRQVWTQDEVKTALMTINGETEFHSLEYFRRMWTFQETLLPDTTRAYFVLGGLIRDYNPYKRSKIKLPSRVWSQVRELVNEEHTKPGTLTAGDQAILSQVKDPLFLRETFTRRTVLHGEAISKALDAGGKRFNLGDLIVATASRQCTKIHDKIFALHGLLHEDPDLPSSKVVKLRSRALEIDYNKPLASVVLDALWFIHHFEGGHHFRMREILAEYHSCSIPERLARRAYGDEYPSWLPDLKRYRVLTYTRKAKAISACRHHGSGTVRWVQYDAEDQTLEVLVFNGTPMGRIQFIYPLPEDEDQVVSRVVEILSEARGKEIRAKKSRKAKFHTDSPGSPTRAYTRRFLSRIASPKSLEERLARIFRRHETSPLHKRISDVKYWQRLEEIRRKQSQGLRLTTRDTLYLHEDSAKFLIRKYLVILDSGDFALCPETVQADDLVFASAAWQEPIVMRPAAERGPSWFRLVTTVIHLDDYGETSQDGTSQDGTSPGSQVEEVNLI